MSTVKSKNLQVGTDATATNNFTIYQPATPDGTLRIGVGNADSPTEVAQVTSSGLSVTGNLSVTGSVPANTGPAFSATMSSAVTLTAATWIKLTFNTEAFDTNSNFDTGTYRFTPTVEGYYQINGSLAGAGATNAYFLVAIYKNGSAFKYGSNFSSGTAGPNSTINALIYMNGTSDYLELYANHAGGTTSGSGNLGSNFDAHLARAA